MVLKPFRKLLLVAGSVMLAQVPANAQVSVKDYERAAIERVRREKAAAAQAEAQRRAAAAKAEAERRAAAAKADADRRAAAQRSQAEQRERAARAQEARLVAEQRTAAQRKAVEGLIAGLKANADRGDAGAARELYLIYVDQTSELFDVVQGMHWLHKSADLGSVSSKKELGLRYKDGNAVARSIPKFSELMEQAADAGDGEAAYILALLHLRGGAISMPLAQTWMAKAADLGWAPAQIERSLYLINAITDKSDGIEVSLEDRNKILSYLNNASKSEVGPSLLAYGRLHENGINFPKDYSKATYFYKKALSLGEASASGYLWRVDPFGYFGRDYSLKSRESGGVGSGYMSCRIKLSSRNVNDDRVDRNFEANEPNSQYTIRINGRHWNFVKDPESSVYKIVGGAPSFFDSSTDPIPHLVDFNNGVFIERVRRHEVWNYSVDGNYFLSHKCDVY